MTNVVHVRLSAQFTICRYPDKMEADRPDILFHGDDLKKYYAIEYRVMKRVVNDVTRLWFVFFIILQPPIPALVMK